MNNILYIIAQKLFPLDKISLSHSSGIESRIENKLFTFLNNHSYFYLRKDMHLLKYFDYIFIDGNLLALQLRIFGIGKIVPVSFDMSSLAQVVFEHLERTEKSIYFVGSQKEEIKLAVEKIQLRYENLKIAGEHEGYFDDDDHRNNIIEQIKNINPAVVIAGMGAIQQEKFLVDLVKSGWNGGGFTCGGFLHQTSKAIDYYPNWVIRYNCRWFYRIISEPKLIPRYVFIYPLSVLLFFIDYIKYRLN